jgi:hypothetical protein
MIVADSDQVTSFICECATEFNAINERFRTHPQSPMGYAFSTVLADLVHHNRWGGDLRKVDGRECSDPEVSKDN